MNIIFTRPLLESEDLMTSFFSSGHKVIHVPTLSIKSASMKSIHTEDYDAFIFMSGYSDYPKDDLLAKGAFIVIDKPINFESLKNKLEKLLA